MVGRYALERVPYASRPWSVLLVGKEVGGNDSRCGGEHYGLDRVGSEVYHVFNSCARFCCQEMYLDLRVKM